MFIKNRHIGVFQVSANIFNDDLDMIHEIFMDVIPIKTEHDFATGQITYTAISEKWFDEVPESCIVPMYDCVFTKHEGKLTSFEFIKTK